MKMNKITLILFLFVSINFFSFESKIMQDTLMYIQIDIRSSDEYPLVFEGVCSNFDFKKLDFNDENSLVNSFYQTSIFFPSLMSYDNVLKEYIINSGDNSFEKYTEKENGVFFSTKFSLNNRGKKVTLNNGKIAVIRILQIEGLFLFARKESISSYNISDGIKIQNIDSIKEICIPLEIYKFNKLKMRYFKSIFKKTKN